MHSFLIAMMLAAPRITQPAGGSAGGYATIQEDGTPLTQRDTVNFTGSPITCSDTGGITVCNVSSGSGNFGTFTTDFGSTAVSVYNSSVATVTAAWVVAGSTILLTPKCVTTVGGNTIDGCLVSKLQCSVVAISSGVSFDVQCFSPITASGGYTISYTGG